MKNLEKCEVRLDVLWMPSNEVHYWTANCFILPSHFKRF